MAEYDTAYRNPATARAEAGVFDAGLRSHMLRVYNYMATALALSGAAALAVAHVPGIQAAFFQFVPGVGYGPTLLGMIAMFAPLGFVLVLGFGINRLSFATAQMVFWVYAAVMGVSLASILLNFTSESVARVFFITAASFAALSLYGYTTKRDLSALGAFLFMGLIGLLIAMIVNIFLQSSMMGFIISIVGVGIFAGLTAYDTQRIKEMYFAGDDSESAGKKALMGALTLYLDFINLFMFLIQLLGNRNSE